MRWCVLKAAALAAVLSTGQAAPAAAQGFLQQLFGLGTPAAAPQAPAPMLTPGGRPYSAPGPANYSPFMSRRPHGDEDDQRSSGSYKTICVRACDGYYFPISNSTSKKGFYRDNMKCRSQCGDDARIFYLPAKTLDVDGAVDLQGRQYGRMTTAYAYRKTLVAGCQCKPDPWAASEVARHQQYADAELDKKLAALPKAEPTSDATNPEVVAEAKIADQPLVAEVVQPKPKAPSQAWKTTTTRAAPKPIQQAQRAPLVQSSSKGTFGGTMGLGGGHLTWPGDTPRRP